jgi:uncharacterized protein YcaQ
MMKPVRVSRRTERRYVLGRQGLWPGRRWTGHDGARRALIAAEAIQVDPLNVIARNHDLAMAARVDGFTPGQLDTLLYTERQFFDYGGTVFIWPMRELPFWRTPMERRLAEPRWASFATENGALIDQVRGELRDRGPLGARDLPSGGTGAGFRSRRLAGTALYYLWLTGELMTHSRRGFERIYFFGDEIAPAACRAAAGGAEAEMFIMRKVLDFLGLCPARDWRGWLCSFARRRITQEETSRKLDELLDEGAVTPVLIEDNPEIRYTSATNAALLEEVEAGGIPATWQPIAATTEQEATLLAPLEIVSARGRAAELFGFDYVWEVYKPAAARRWGYYTMPVLYGDSLAGRIDPKLDRKRSVVVVNGAWLEQPQSADAPAVIGALARALQRLAGLAGAEHIDVSPVAPAPLRRELASQVKAMRD